MIQIIFNNIFNNFYSNPNWNKNWKIRTEHPRDVGQNQSNIHIIGIPGGEEREGGGNNIWRNNIWDSFKIDDKYIQKLDSSSSENNKQDKYLKQTKT